MGKEGGPVHNDGEFSLCPLKILKVSDVSLRSSEKRHDTSSVARHKFHVYGSVDSAVWRKTCWDKPVSMLSLVIQGRMEVVIKSKELTRENGSNLVINWT